MLGFLALLTHVGTLLFDKYAGIHLSTLFGIHAQWPVLLGAIAFWIALALPISFHLKQRKLLVNQKFWRNFHYLGYSVWALALIHGIAQGTDTGSIWALAAYGTSAAIAPR
jgi:DMSO/TMAO reductase YedYZ heme-binding membrane subunit